MQNVDKTVRVAYVNSKKYQEGGEGEYKFGFGYEYLQRISYITGWKYEYYYGTFPELFKMLINGEVDIMGDISYTPERAEYINYSTLAEMQDTYSLITRYTQQRISLDKLETLNGKKIGVTKNSYQKNELEKWLKERNIQCTIVEADSGAMGGSGSQEFMAKNDQGEDEIAVCNHCDFAANIEKAKVVFNRENSEVEMFDMEKVSTPAVKTIDELLEFFNKELGKNVAAKDFLKAMRPPLFSTS